MTKKEIAEALVGQKNRAVWEIQRIAGIKDKDGDIYNKYKSAFDTEEAYYKGWNMAIYQVAIDLGVDDKI